MDNNSERAAINFAEGSNQPSCRHFMFKDSVSEKPGALVIFFLRGKRTQRSDAKVFLLYNFFLK